MDPARKKMLIGLLKEVDREKPYGTELFNAISLLSVGVAIEMVCLRLVERSVEVYLTQRSEDDTAYAGEWHCPGSFVRPGEKVPDVFKRISKKEMNDMKFISTRFVANVNHPTEERGHVLSVVYLCIFKGSCTMDDVTRKSNLPGKFFSIDELPEKTVETHRKRIIPVAAGLFVAENTNICV